MVDAVVDSRCCRKKRFLFQFFLKKKKKKFSFNDNVYIIDSSTTCIKLDKTNINSARENNFPRKIYKLLS